MRARACACSTPIQARPGGTFSNQVETSLSGQRNLSPLMPIGLNFRYCEKATKFEEKFPLFGHYLITLKQCFYSNFVSFLQYLYFNKNFVKKTFPHYSHMFRWTCKHVPGARDNDAKQLLRVCLTSTQ